MISGSPVLVGLLPADVGKVSVVNPTSCNFVDKNIGSNKAVIFSDFTLSGSMAGNYVLTQATGFKANITKTNLVIGVTASDKDYDGSKD